MFVALAKTEKVDLERYGTRAGPQASLSHASRHFPRLGNA